jgi:hypothetical protein
LNIQFTGTEVFIVFATRNSAVSVSKLITPRIKKNGGARRAYSKAEAPPSAFLKRVNAWRMRLPNLCSLLKFITLSTSLI